MGGDLELDGIEPGGPHAPTPHPPSRAGLNALREASMGGMSEFLWALDIGADGWPMQSHPIVTIEGEKPYRSFITACGRRYQERQRGCWGTDTNENPLPTLACPNCEAQE